MNETFYINGLNHWNWLANMQIFNNFKLLEVSLMSDGRYVIGGYYK